MRKTTRGMWVVLAGLTIWGCSGDGSNGPVPQQSASTGRLDLYLTDAPLQADLVREALVRIEQIEARQGAEWVVVDTTPKTVDLIPLRDGKKALLCSASLATGSWVEVRLTLGPAQVTLRDGRSFAVPAPAQVRVPLQGVAVGDSPKELTLDFDLEKSFDLSGSTISLTPHVVVYQPATPSSGAAAATPPAPSAAITPPAPTPVAGPPTTLGSSLLRAFGPERTTGKATNTSSFTAPTTQGTWFLTVERDKAVRATVRLNGATVLEPSDFQGHDRRLLRVPVRVALQNQVEVTLSNNSKKRGLSVVVDGIVSEGEVPPAQVRRVVFVSPLYQETFLRRSAQTRTVPLLSSEGLFTLRVALDGAAGNQPHARLGWNGERLFNESELRGTGSSFEAPVDVRAANDLEVHVKGPPGGEAQVTLEGWVVDTTPPAIAILNPAAGACVGGSTVVSLDLGDALPSTLYVELNGVPTTEAFAVSGSSATAVLSTLSGLQEGSNTLRVLAQDAARNLGEATVTFEADTTGPALTLVPANGTQVVSVATVTAPPPGPPGPPRIEVAPFAPTEAASTHSNASGDHAFWLPDLPGGPTYVFVDEPTFYEYSGGLAYLSATIASSSDPTKRWIASILFESTTAQPKLELRPEHYVQNGGPIDPSTWRYWRFVPGQATLIGDGSFAGKRLDLFMRPASGTYAFQHGLGANGKNLNLGLSGWLGYTGDFSATRGDINVDLAPATRTALPIPLCAAYQDAGCGLSLPTLGFEASLDGATITDAFTVAIDAAKAVSPPLAAGTHTFTACVSDVVGNKSTVSSTFELVLQGDLRGFAIGGRGKNSLHPIPGVRVQALVPGSAPVVTDAQGRFLIPNLPAGAPVAVVADGLAVGFGRTTLSFVVEPGSQVTTADRVFSLPLLSLSPAVPLNLDPSGRTQAELVITEPASGASISIPAGSQVNFPAGFSFPSGVTPAFSLHRVPLVLTGAPLPNNHYAPYFYSLQPEGIEIVGGYDLVLPNHELRPPGATVPFFLLDPTTGQFAQNTTLTVDASGLFVRGRSNTLSSLGAEGAGAALLALGFQLNGSNYQGAQQILVNSCLVQAGGMPLSNLSQCLAGGTATTNLPVSPTQPSQAEVLVLIEDQLPGETGSQVSISVQGPGVPSGTTSVTLSTIQVTRVSPRSVKPGDLITVVATTAQQVALKAVVGSVEVDLIPRGTVALGPGVGAGVGLRYEFPTGSGLPDGPFGLRVNQTGFESTLFGEVGLFDQTGPLVSLSAPNGTKVVGTMGSLLFDLSDATSGLSSLRVERQSGSTWSQVANQGFGVSNGEGPKTGAAAFAVSVSEGLNTFRGVALDAAGNESISGALTLVADTTPPVFTSPTAPETAFKNAPVSMTVTATDSASGVARIELHQVGFGVIETRAGGSGSFTLVQPFQNGTFQFFYRAIDNCGNSIDAPQFECTFDDQAPLVALAIDPNPLNPNPAFLRLIVTATERPAVDFSGLDVGRWLVSFNGGPFEGDDTKTLSFDMLAMDTDNLSQDVTNDGRYRLRVEVTDRAGNTGEAFFDHVRDTEAPVVSRPQGGVPPVIPSGSQVVQYLICDTSGVNSSGVDLRLNGVPLNPSLTQTQTPVLIKTLVTIDLAKLQDGAYSLGLTATDQVGLQTQTNDSFVVDNGPPVIASFSNCGPITSQSVVPFEATYFDATTSVPSGKVKATLTSMPVGGSQTTTDVTSLATIDGTSFSYAPSLPDGTHTLTLTVEDEAGNKTSQSLTSTVDTQQPTVTVTEPGSGSVTPAKPTLRATVADVGGTGVEASGVRVLQDSTDVTGQAQVSGSQVTFTPSVALSEGAHSFAVEVTDRAGNTRTETRAFQVDGLPPSAPGVPVAGARPLAPTTTLRWAPSVDPPGGSGVKEYVVLRSEDGGKTITEVGRTASTEFEIVTPTGEETILQVKAVDNAGNESPASQAHGCEVAAINDLTTPVTTTLQVRALGTDGSPITNAVVTETATSTPLPHVGSGVYRSNPVTVAAGQPLTLQLAVDGTVFVSGPLLPLLPEVASTDFGVVTISKRRQTGHVLSAGGGSPGPAGVQSLGFTIGEGTAAGPPVQTNAKGTTLVSGFWHSVEVEGDPTTEILQLSPVLCGRYIPIYFEVVADQAAVDVTAEFSLDGSSYAPLTLTTGSTATSLPGTPNGQRHVVLWDTSADLGELSLADVIIRISPTGAVGRGDTAKTTLLRAFEVSSATPAAGSLEVDPQGTFQLEFTAALTSDIANLNSSVRLEVRETGTTVPVSVSSSGSSLTVTPTSPLVPGTHYELRVLPGLLAQSGSVVFDQDVHQAGLNPYVAHYRTGGVDTTEPTLLSSTPAQGAGGVSPPATVELVFSETLAAATVSAQTFTLASHLDGQVATSSVTLNPDGRTVVVAAAFAPGRCYTVSVSPQLADLAGNTLGKFTNLTFTTAASSGASPAAPVIVSPANGSTVTTAAPLITGTAPPRHEVRLFVNGFNTGLRAAADDTGAWSITPFELPEGPVTLAAVATPPGGVPASALSPDSTFEVSTSRLPSTLPAGPGETDRHELIPGADDQKTLHFTGSPGAPFVIDFMTLKVSAGINVSPRVVVDPANGGGTHTAQPGSQTFPGGTFDAQGEARLTYFPSDVNGEEHQIQLRNPIDPAAPPTAPQIVAHRAPMAFFVADQEPPFVGPVPVTISLRARLLRSPTPTIIRATNYGLCLIAVDQSGQPTDAVTINGQPGSTGANIQTNAAGDVQAMVEVVDKTVPFRLVGISKVSYDCPPGVPPTLSPLGESSLWSDAPIESDAVLFLTQPDAPYRNPCEGREGSNGISTGCPTPDPIYFNNGGMYLNRVDLAIPGRGLSFAFTRSYKSYVLYDGPIGQGWTHGYDMRLVQDPGGDVGWLTGTARSETFASLGGGRFKTPEGFFNRLTFDASGVGTIREPNGVRYVFRPFTAATAGGKLSEIRDRHGNRLTFEYGTSGVEEGRLVKVVESLGREIDLLYNAQGRIRLLRDFLGREVRYEYGTRGDLVRVTSPAVVTTTKGAPILAENQFPNGKSEIYGYRNGFADERLNHNMFLIVAPNEAVQVSSADLENAAVLTPLARMQNTFDQDPASASFARVIKQRLGGNSRLPAWTGQAGTLKAGGDFALKYQTLTVPAGASLNHPAQVVTLTDRNGNLRDYFLNRAGQCVRVREHTNRNVRPSGPDPLQGQDPEFFELNRVYNADGLLISQTRPLGGRTRWIYGQEDLNGDGLLTAGVDRNGDGDFDDPEDTQPEDSADFAFKPGNSTLDALPRQGEINLLRNVRLPDARLDPMGNVVGDTRGGLRERVSTFQYEPIYNMLRAATDARAHDASYTPQNGGPNSLARYTTVRFFDYQQDLNSGAALAALAAEIGETTTFTQQLLTDAGVALGLGDKNEFMSDDTRRVGDVVRVEAPSVTLTASQTLLRGVEGGSAQAIVSLAQFNEFGQVVRAVDPERNVHTIDYYPEADPDGDGTLTISSRPLPSSTGGYVRQTTADVSSDPGRNSNKNPTPVQITASFRYDAVGNLVATTDPRGIQHVLEVNPLNQVVRAVSAADATTTLHASEPDRNLVSFSYEAIAIYDHNNNVIESRIENAGERDGSATTVAANPFWARKTAFDILDNPVLALAEVDAVANDSTLSVTSPGVIVSRVLYDPNENVQCVIKPEGNELSITYDERNLPFQTIVGYRSQDQAIYTSHYDLNGNPLLSVDAKKHNPGKNPGFTGDVTRTIYNGFDEVTCTLDAESNFGAWVRDPLGKGVRYVRFGPAEEGHPRLSEVEFHHDEIGRRFQTDVRIFETQSPLSTVGLPTTIPVVGGSVPAGEDQAIHLAEFDALSRVVRGVDPKGDESLVCYDGASRVIQAEGPLVTSVTGQGQTRNEVLISYNQASQVTTVEARDRSPVKAAETFISRRVYDAVGRLVRATDPIGQTSRLAYDSRSNVVAASDAKSGGSLVNDPFFNGPQINTHGNVAHLFYDGISRPVAAVQALKVGGVGNGSLDLGGFTGLDTSNTANADGLITTSQTWDRNSRLVSRADDNGNTTGYLYDQRDRRVATTAADLTTSFVVYDADSMPIQTVDRNGTAISSSFDGLGRILSRQATRLGTNLEGTGQAVEGTTVQAWEYDGLSRLRLCLDNNDAADGQDDVANAYTWDSLSRLRSELHQFKVNGVVNSTFTTNNKITVTTSAASIQKTVGSQYDRDSNRIGCTYPSGRQLTTSFDGQDRAQRVSDAGGAIASWEYVGGARPVSLTAKNGVTTSYAYDANRRLTGIDHVNASSTRVAGFGYTFDRTNLRTTEQHLTSALPGRTEAYSYDSASRVTNVSFGDSRPNTSYQIDGVGNWVSRTEGGETQQFNRRQPKQDGTGKYSRDVMNEYRELLFFDAAGSFVKSNQSVHDKNGNRIKDSDRKLTFDLFDRLVRVENLSDGTQSRYRYDCAGRRTQKRVEDAAAVLQEETYYVCDGAQEIEEVSAAGAVVADYVYGASYIDQPVQMRRGGGEFYFHTDSLFSVAALTDASGAVVERYRFESIYGVTKVLDPAGGARAPPAEIGNPYRFQGRRFDSESGLYFFRQRFLDPAQGRFVSRDPLGLWGDPGNVGNPYSFCGNDPVNSVDPFGLESYQEFISGYLRDYWNRAAMDSLAVGYRQLHSYLWTLHMMAQTNGSYGSFAVTDLVNQVGSIRLVMAEIASTYGSINALIGGHEFHYGEEQSGGGGTLYAGPPSDLSPLVGSLQVLGGTIELGASGFLFWTGAGSPAAVVLGAHGLDTLHAGYRTLSGPSHYVAETHTHQGITGAAQALGASRVNALIAADIGEIILSAGSGIRAARGARSNVSPCPPQGAAASQSVVPRVPGSSTLTPSEVSQIQAIANEFDITISVGGSRAFGSGRGVTTGLPVGKGPGTRSDIDFIFDMGHPHSTEIMNQLRTVGGGAGSIHPDHRFLSEFFAPPMIVFTPGQSAPRFLFLNPGG